MSDQTQVRIRLPKALAEKLLGLSSETRAKVVGAALAQDSILTSSSDELRTFMGTWSPDTLSLIAEIMEAVKDGRLKWMPDSLLAGAPYRFTDPNTIYNLALLLRESEKTFRARWHL